MSGNCISGIRGPLLLLILISNIGFSQETNRLPVRLMFYNVENLFDIYDDTLKNDNEFLPEGLGDGIIPGTIRN